MADAIAGEEPIGPGNGNKYKYIGNYELGRTIGEGAFAKVKEGSHRLTEQKVAIKIIDKDKLPDEYALRNVHREAAIMKLLDHPHVVQLFEVIETKKELYLIMELADRGELLDYIIAHERLREAEARKFTRQMVEALVVHRDLKAENLLLDAHLNIKISDFGLSNNFDKAKTLSTCCGSPVYSAPELIEGKKYIGPEVDIWSVGINLYAMVVGDLPFSDSTLGGLFQAISKGKFHLPDYLSDDCKDLLTKILQVNPKKRLTCAQILSHPWLAPTTSKSENRAAVAAAAASAMTAAALSHVARVTEESALDKDILEQLDSMGFEKESAIKNILNARYNQMTATYYLLVLQKRKAAHAASLPLTTTTAAGTAAALTSQPPLPLLLSPNGTRIPQDVLMNPNGTMAVTSGGTSRLRSAGKFGPLKQGALQAAITPSTTPAVTTTTITPAMVTDDLMRGNLTRDGRIETIMGNKMTEEEEADTISMTPLALREIDDYSSQSSQSTDYQSPKSTTGSLRSGPSAAKGLSTLPNRRLSATIQLKVLPMTTTFTRRRAVSNASDESGGEQTPATRSVPAAATPLLPASGSPAKPKTSAHLPPLSRRASSSAISSTVGTAAEPSIMLSSDLLNDLPGANPDIRALRFAFSAATTSAHTPAQIASDIERTLKANHISYTIDHYLFSCTVSADLRFDMEICRLPNLSNFYGIRFKRIIGEVADYKRTYTKLIQELSL